MMSILKMIKNLFKDSENSTKSLKTIKDLSLLDDVWVLDNDEIYKGWIWDISRRCITVVYGPDLFDYKFRIPRPLTDIKIEQDHKILYCNEPER